jgi:hypothetical protein
MSAPQTLRNQLLNRNTAAKSRHGYAQQFTTMCNLKTLSANRKIEQQQNPITTDEIRLIAENKTVGTKAEQGSEDEQMKKIKFACNA